MTKSEPAKIDKDEAVLYALISPSTRRIIRLLSFVLGALALVLVILQMSIGSSPDFLFGLSSANLKILQVLSVIIFSGLSFCLASFLLERMTARCSFFKFREDSIEFPIVFAPDLLFRRTRSLSDVSGILLGSMLTGKNDSRYDIELESSANKRKLLVYFKSGGHAAIDLNRLTSPGIERLFRYLESSYLEFSRSPHNRAPGINKDRAPGMKLLLGMDNTNNEEDIDDDPLLKARSFTELWENEMQEHFSATCYVPLRKGARVQGGKYRVLMQLSAGGFSAIYLVETQDRELRILKESVLPISLAPATIEKAKEMFRKEALLLTKLSNPGIARIYDFFVEQERDYLVLEFIPGQSLSQLSRHRGFFAENEVTRIFLELAKILDYLHGCDPPVIHRDVAPDNIVIREDGSIALIDFGAALEYIGTATGTMVGKQSYMAPEQFRGKAHLASDIYSLGATMYFLLTAREPEPLSSSHPREINRSVSPELDELIARCTALEVQERFRSAKELIDNLERANSSLSISLNPEAGVADGA